MHTLSVSALNEQIKGLLEESFSRVLVEGELSRITFHNSGHIYFTLKDANSSVRAVMFRGNATKLKFQLQEGQKVILDGALSLYKPRGEYQINCFSIEPSGQGALALAFEQLKQKLSAQGYFNPDIKKQLPRFPKKIALITSATGAALQDMLRVANSRYRNLEIDIYDVLVQGQSAAYEIANAIIYSDTKEYDIIIVGRGGGSIEDLWAFNEEIVADAIYRATTPIVSAVGHEIDWVISDFVADVRAATPSNAMQIALPDTNELYQYLDSIEAQLIQTINQKIYNKSQELTHLYSSYSQHSIEKKLSLKNEEIASLQKAFTQNIEFKLQKGQRELAQIKSNFPYAIESVLKNSQSKISHIQNSLEANNPKRKNRVGFAQISKDGKVVDVSSLSIEDTFEAQNSDYSIRAKVVEKVKF
jgi:exodeoxyribonuclease VII large subunit